MSRLTLRQRWLVVMLALLCASGAAALLFILGTESDPAPAAAAKRSILAQPYEADSTSLDSCRKLESPRLMPCRKQALANIAFRQGPDVAFTRLTELAAADPSWLPDTHIVQHGIGSGTLARLKGDVGAAIAAGARTSTTPGTGGYLHGILLVALGETTRKDLVSKASSFCASSSVRADGALTYWCLHGVGHSLMIYSGNDLPWALRGCDQLDGPSDQGGCYIGVFMENYGRFIPMMRATGAYSQYVKDDDILYPCNWVDTRYKSSCYIQLMIRVAPVIGADFRRIPGVCRQVEDPHKQTCYASTGTLAFDVGRGDPLRMAQLCGWLQEGAPACTASAVQALFGTRDRSGMIATRLCAATATSQRSPCYEAIGRIVASSNPATHAATCRRLVPQNYLPSCLRSQ